MPEPQTDLELTLDADDTMKSFCPLFNEFSPSVNSADNAIDQKTTLEAAQKDDYHVWWYSCQSAGNPFIAGNRLTQNVGNNENSFINENPLAIVRANVWQEAKLGIEGQLYWSVDEYKREDCETLKYYGVDSNGKFQYSPWLLTDNEGNEGIMVYPNYDLICNLVFRYDELLQAAKDELAADKAEETDLKAKLTTETNSYEINKIEARLKELQNVLIPSWTLRTEALQKFHGENIDINAIFGADPTSTDYAFYSYAYHHALELDKLKSLVSQKQSAWEAWNSAINTANGAKITDTYTEEDRENMK